jgi:tetratricopeptide (TPR) repeat protein
MELLYNPDQMPESEVKETFVAREQLLDDLVELIKSQPEGAGVRHAVIIAPRGMGKTTVLLMVKFAVKDRGLAGQWQVVKFPEESYGIYDLADLWIQTLELIAADTGDAELRRLTNDLKIEYPQNDELQEAAYAAIRYWRRKHSKRLLLLVENFDQILEQINDERDNARLREVLMNDGTIMILGGATNFFKEARAYDQPLYNFFKIYDIADLKLAQMQELLRRRAKVDRIADFETKLKQNASRLRALKYFTGGNPRLVLMLYRVVSRSNVTEVRRALEKLLDEVTPYYKAKVEMLPPQQRKILDHIARVSGQTSQGMTPKEIAGAVRLPQNQTSAQLKRLAELGYVRVANLRGRSSWYTLSEPLYALWHQMRLGPGARERMKWLVVFLRLWYSVDEMDAESRRLSTRFHESLSANRFSEASDILTHHRYLVEAMEETPLRIRALESVICSYLELKDFQTIRNDLLRGSDMSEFSEETIQRLLDSGCIRLDEIKVSSASRGSIALSPEEEEIAELLSQTVRAQLDGRMEDAQRCFNKVVNLRPHLGAVWDYNGYLLFRLGHYEEAIVSYDQAVKLNPDDSDIWVDSGKALTFLGEREKALARYDHALEIKPDNDTAWFGRGIVYLQWSLELAQEGKFGAARERWNDALASGGKSNDENWPDVVAAILLDVVIAGQFEFARQLITETGMEEQLFPLARAIDYLQTEDESLIEKLSPEVRGIVEEVVAKLREISQTGS